MLKWLVTRGPTNHQAPPRQVVTDDPLAILKVNTNKRNTAQEVYAVSRVNPLYHDEEVEITSRVEEEDEDEAVEVEVEQQHQQKQKQQQQQQQQEVVNPPESPPTDRGSVRSSGYGSKETDSVSDRSDAHYDDDLLGAEVEAALTSPPVPPAFSDGHRASEVCQRISGTDEPSILGPSKTLQTVAQLRQSFEESTVSQDTPSVISIAGKPAATIVSQHPQYVQAIEVGMRRARSLEMIHQRRIIQTSGSSTVPRPVWPRVNSFGDRQQAARSILQPLQELASQDSQFKPRVPSPVDIVKQDLRYVTSIDVTPARPLSRAKTHYPGYPRRVPGSANTLNQLPPRSATLTRPLRLSSGDNNEDSSIIRYFGEEQQGSFSLMSLQPDSLVNEDTLRMMRYGKDLDDLDEEGYESPIQVMQKQSLSAPLPDFSQAVYTKGLYATLNRAATFNTKDIVKPPYKTRSRSIDLSAPSHKQCAMKKGLTTVKDLWEKSGLKTNGRKLIVSVDDLLNSSLEQSESDAKRRSESSVENLRSFRSEMVANSRRAERLESDATTNTHRSSNNTYEELSSFDNNRFTSHTSTDTSKSSSGYAEISDVDGIDNPAFVDDSGRLSYPSHAASSPKRFLDPDKLAEFQKKISEKLQGAPLHRMQWLDLDEIVVEDVGDKHGRRVKFTADTINKGSLERGSAGGHRIDHLSRGSSSFRGSSSPLPGGALRTTTFQGDDVEALEGRRLQELALQPLKMAGGETDHNGIWSISESYRDRFQEAPPSGTVGRGRRQQLWETYYGTTGLMDRTLPRHLAPHPNSQAPMCGRPGSCHDFTLDLRRSDKLKRRSLARKKRRRCYAVVVIALALSVFVGVVVAISLYYTDGEKFFGSM